MKIEKMDKPATTSKETEEVAKIEVFNAMRVKIL
jgi:hypothetical protein